MSGPMLLQTSPNGMKPLSLPSSLCISTSHYLKACFKLPPLQIIFFS